MLHLNLIAC